MDLSLEQTFRRTQWRVDAADAALGNAHREAEWVHVRRCAIGFDLQHVELLLFLRTIFV